VGVDAGHTDVSLWFPLVLRTDEPLHIDRREFRSMRANTQPWASGFSWAYASVRPSLLASGGAPRTIPRAMRSAK
jgi:hypothetical protein